MHRQVTLPGGPDFDVDVSVAPLVEALRAAGASTTNSCSGMPELGYEAYISFADLESLSICLDLCVELAERASDQRLRDAIMGDWLLGAENLWVWGANPREGVDLEVDDHVSLTSDVRFPTHDLEALWRVLRPGEPYDHEADGTGWFKQQLFQAVANGWHLYPEAAEDVEMRSLAEDLHAIRELMQGPEAEATRDNLLTTPYWSLVWCSLQKYGAVPQEGP